MTDGTIARVALGVAILALVLGVLHALTRDSDNGGPAHMRGFGFSTGTRPVPGSAT